MMTRSRFHEELDDLEREILVMGGFAEEAVRDAVEALVASDPAKAQAVIASDDRIDDRYLDIEQRALQVLALQTPVASDLRLLSAILHINQHLERIGDQAVNIAKIFLSVSERTPDRSVVAHIREMGDIVRPMIRSSLEALRTRDLDLCLSLPEMDDPVDRLNLGMYEDVTSLASDPDALEWGLRMLVLARNLERVGDHAVDIAEQVGFLLTGEFREFTDASHPVDPP